MDKRLFLIDGNSYCYRAYYAIKELKTDKGFPTNAIYGFFNMLNKIIHEENPSYMAVSFDTKEPTFRHKEYKEYKIHRKPMPDDLVIQLPWIKKILIALDISIYEVEGYEADDVIATLATRFKKNKIEVYIGTSDKDILQLVDHNLKVYRPYDKVKSVLGIPEVVQKYGVTPDKIADFLALKGDSSDNIPGIPGIGKKTAAKLISKYGGIEKIFSNLEKIESFKLREKISHYKNQAFKSKELTKLDTDISISVELEDLTFNSKKKEKLIPIFETLEFNKLIEKIYSKSL